MMPSKKNYHKKAIAASFATIILSACGGGGNANESQTPPSNPTAPDSSVAPSKLMKFTDGDSYTYSSSGQYFNAPADYPTEPSTSYYTNTIKNPAIDFSHDVIATSTPPGSPAINHINKENQTESYKTKFIDCKHINEKERPNFLLQLGEKWSSNYKRTCDQTSSTVNYEHSSTGKIAQRENYTTEAGTFATLKTEITSTQVSSLATTINQRTCWYDEISAQAVACQGHTKSTSTTVPNFNYERKYTISLIGINTKNHPIKNNRVERFSGHWDIKIGSNERNKCQILIEITGQASGTCSRDGYTFDMKGAVTPEGFIALVNHDSSLGLAGNFTDPSTINGTWKTSWENGTWAGIPTNSP